MNPVKHAGLKAMTVDQLVDRFAEIGVAQDQALLYDEHKKFNRLFSDMNEVDQELRRRGLETRLALTRLYDHPNMQVRLKAAKRTLGVAPEAARKIIQAIYDSKWYPQAGEAGMTLWNLDRGVFSQIEGRSKSWEERRKAELMGEISKYNSLYRQMDDVDQEFRRRGATARLASLRLYSHPNIQVRLKAAIRTLAVAPDAARIALQEIKETHSYPQAADASLFLRDFDNGSYKPD